MEQRYERGWIRLKEVDGGQGERVIKSLKKITPDLGRYVIEFAFRDIYTRPGLNLKQRQLHIIVAYNSGRL